MRELQIYEGTWEQVKLHDQELRGHEVRLFVLGPRHPTEPLVTGANMLTFGMFPQARDLTEEDFEIAEWRGENLDI